MANEPHVYRQLWQQFHGCTSIDELVVELGQMENLVASGELTLANAYELRNRAFLTLQELTAEDAGKAVTLILELLLPYCFEQISDEESEVRISISRHRQLLRDWIDQYPEEDRIPLRNGVLDALRQGLASAEPEGACWTAAAIGFRRPDIAQALRRLADADAGEVGDAALSSLTSLGVEDEDRAGVLSALHQRAAIRCSSRLIGALRRLADPKSVEVVLDYWLQPKYFAPQSRLGSIALRILADVADANDTDADLQDRVWHIVSNLFTEYADVLSSDLHLGSDIAPRCDGKDVVPFLMNWLGKEDEQSEGAAYSRWLLNLRLEECVRPRQISGWKRIDKPQAVALLRQDAVQDTQHRGLLASAQMQHKEMAWKILLCLGHQDLLSLCEKGIALETNPYLRQKLTKLLANFRLDPLPAKILRLVTEPFDAESGGDSREWIARLAATDVAQSAGTWQAFEALLNFGLTVDGMVMKKSADALSVVAVALARGGESGVTDRLVETLISGREPRHRLVAAAALEVMGNVGLMPAHHGQQLAPLLADKERGVLELSEIVAVLGWLPADEFTEDVVQRLLGWARDNSDRLGGRSLETLARHGRLTTQPELLSERLGLQRVAGKWDWSAQPEPAWQASFVLGLLYWKAPDDFTAPVCSLLRTADWQTAFPVVSLLGDVHSRPDQPVVPDVITEALVDRVRRRHTRVYAEIEIFDVLALIAPDALAHEPWNSFWDEMLPNARAALADALGIADYAHAHSQSKALSHLLLLTRDGQYAVRRAAYRALARRSIPVLRATCQGWSEAPSVELRQRAAEACVWLPAAETRPDAFDELYERLAADPERVVRDTAVRARQERRERLWSEDYLSRVLGIKDPSNDRVFAVWPYAQALIQIGDDSCRQAIRDKLTMESLLPHVRNWLQYISGGIEQRWRKVTQKWPEPWFPWEGAIEEGQGEVIPPRKKAVSVRYSTWHQPAPTPSEPPSWGGAVWPIESVGIQWNRFALKLEDGRQGTAMRRGFLGRIMTFSGIGSYPAQGPESGESGNE